MDGTLYVVGTPIGNLGDLSQRARETLASVRLVAAEDTRRTGRLLAGLGIEAPMLSVFDANEASRIPRIVAALAEGDVALVSDGGMPLISDPGYRVVRAVLEAGGRVRVIPGPSAVVAALAVSGLPADRFVFEGFVPKKAGERAARLAALAAEPRTIVCFESPRRVRATLDAIVEVMGPGRPVAVCRELTKLHEDVVRGTAAEVASAIGEPRGEVVVVIGGAPAPAADLDAAVDHARRLVLGGAAPREASKRAAATTGTSVNQIYAALIAGHGDLGRLTVLPATERPAEDA
jgi:16S rRNA (cytidine1402-2'-O)-methyltransferase